MDPVKIEGVLNWPEPSNVTDVQSFIGFVNFYRRFIKGFSQVASPLSHLLQKEAEFDFSSACKEAFVELKSRLISPPILVAPNWELPFELSCDASNEALGAMLGQRHDSLPRVIAYASKTLDRAQRNYTTTQSNCIYGSCSCSIFVI